MLEILKPASKAVTEKIGFYYFHIDCKCLQKILQDYSDVEHRIVLGNGTLRLDDELGICKGFNTPKVEGVSLDNCRYNDDYFMTLKELSKLICILKLINFTDQRIDITYDSIDYDIEDEIKEKVIKEFKGLSKEIDYDGQRISILVDDKRWVLNDSDSHWVGSPYSDWSNRSSDCNSEQEFIIIDEDKIVELEEEYEEEEIVPIQQESQRRVKQSLNLFLKDSELTQSGLFPLTHKIDMEFQWFDFLGDSQKYSTQIEPINESEHDPNRTNFELEHKLEQNKIRDKLIYMQNESKTRDEQKLSFKYKSQKHSRSLSQNHKSFHQELISDD